MPDYSAGQAYLTVLPSLTGFGEKVREQLARENLDVVAQVKPKVDTAEAAKQGEEYGGAFGNAVRGRIEAALKGLPSPKIDADSSEADRKIAELRARLDELRGKQIGVDIDAATALAEIKAVKGELDALGRSTARVDVKADVATASAELAAVKGEVDDLKNSNAKVNVDTSGAKSGINGLLLAGLALGPALIPVGAAVAAALGAIGTGAIAGAAGLGVLKLGFSGVTQAVQALDTFQVQSAQNAKQNAAQQVSTANSIASAQDGVKTAVQGVTDAQRSAAIANENSARQVESAQRGVADAMIATGISIHSALEAQTRAEQTLASAQQQELTAQQALTNARQAAQRQLESLTQQVQDGALAERQAALDIQNAQLALDQVKANPAATVLQREQAQLTFDQANQHLSDLRVQNKNLAEDKAAADKAGVDGSQQVVAAQNGVASANQAVANAQQGVADAAANLAEAQRAGAERVAVAQEALATAQQQQTETARAGLESIQKAQEGVISAQRSLQNALVQASAQGNSALDTLNAALAKLTPTGQQFARFLYSLKPQFQELQAAAQNGLLPGVEDGIKSLLPYLPSFKDFIGGIASVLGDMARQVGAALGSPFWRQFGDFVKSEAGPSLRDFGTILGNVATGVAGLLQALGPVWDAIRQGMVDLSTRFANFGKDAAAGKSGSFAGFLQYVKDTWPQVKELFLQLGELVGHIVQAFSGQGGGQGGGTLSLLIEALKLINKLPLPVIQGLIDLFVAYKLYLIGKDVVSALGDVIGKLIGPNSVLSSLRKIKSEGGLKGALGSAGLAAGGLVVGAAALGAAGVADNATGGSLTKGLNAAGSVLSPGAPATPSPTLGQQIGHLFSGDLPTTAVKPGNFNDIRNWLSPASYVQAWRDAKSQVGGIWDSITGNAGTSFGKTSDVIGGKTKDTTDNVKGTWAPAPGWLGVNWGQIASSAGDWWGRTRSTIGDKAHGAYLDVTGKMTDLGSWLSGKWSDIWSDAGAKFGHLRDDVSGKASDTKNWVSQHISDLGGWLSGKWSDIWGTATRWWGRLRDDVSGTAGDLWQRVTGWVGRLGNDVAGAFQWCVDRVRDIWNRLGDIAKAPVNFVIDVVYNRGIRPLWNGIAGLFGLGQLAPVPLLAEGGAVPVQPMIAGKPMAIIGEGNSSYPEYVIPTDPRYRSRALDLWSQAGGQLMADGGIIGDLWGGVKSVAGDIVGGIKDAGSWFASIAGDVVGGVRRLFSSVLTAGDHTPGGGSWTDALKAIPGRVVDAVVKAAQDFVSGIGPAFTATGGGGAGVTRWANVILQALSMVGAPPGLLPNVERRMNQESGGNPTIVNTWDSNWLAGTPSVGLMQVIGPTFRRYADQFAGVGPFEYGVSVNPLANTYAGLNYARHAYPSIQFAMDKAGGYDSGGWLPPGLSVAYNGTGQHERVLTGPQWRAVSNAARGGDGPQVVVNVHPRPEHDPAQIADMVSRRLSFAMRTGA